MPGGTIADRPAWVRVERCCCCGLPSRPLLSCSRSHRDARRHCPCVIPTERVTRGWIPAAVCWWARDDGQWESGLPKRQPASPALVHHSKNTVSTGSKPSPAWTMPAGRTAGRVVPKCETTTGPQDWRLKLRVFEKGIFQMVLCVWHPRAFQRSNGFRLELGTEPTIQCGGA
jgi:hypothetical protein